MHHDQLVRICSQAVGLISLRLGRRSFPWKQAEAFYSTAENAQSAVRLLHGLQLGKLPLQASIDSRFLAWISKTEKHKRPGGHYRFGNRPNQNQSLREEQAVVEYMQPVVHVDERGIQRHMSRGSIMHYPQSGYSLWDGRR